MAFLVLVTALASAVLAPRLIAQISGEALCAITGGSWFVSTGSCMF